jgi:hypothetical protein
VPGSSPHGDSNSGPPDWKLGALIKWLANGFKSKSQQASHSSLPNLFGTAHGYREKSPMLLRQAREYSSDMPSCVRCQKPEDSVLHGSGSPI